MAQQQSSLYIQTIHGNEYLFKGVNLDLLAGLEDAFERGLRTGDWPDGLIVIHNATKRKMSAFRLSGIAQIVTDYGGHPEPKDLVGDEPDDLTLRLPDQGKPVPYQPR